MKRFVENQFSSSRVSTKIAASLTRVIESANSTYKFMIWDTMGQEKYNALTPFYYRGNKVSKRLDADIVLIVFDKSDLKSYTRVKELVNAVLANSSKRPCRLLITSHQYRNEQNRP